METQAKAWTRFRVYHGGDALVGRMTILWKWSLIALLFLCVSRWLRTCTNSTLQEFFNRAAKIFSITTVSDDNPSSISVLPPSWEFGSGAATAGSEPSDHLFNRRGKGELKCNRTATNQQNTLIQLHPILWTRLPIPPPHGRRSKRQLVQDNFTP